MKILMLAPQPYFEERGTLIAIDLLLQVFSRRNEQVDLLTLHLGEDRQYPGLSIHRVNPWPAPKSVPPGLSLAKIWCNLFLLLRAFRMSRKGGYDLVHAVEEAGFIAYLLKRIRGIPYVLDVDSSMTTQIIDRFRWLSPLESLMRRLESIPAKHALAIVPMCEALADEAERVSSSPVYVLHDIALPGDPAAEAEDLRQALGISNAPLLMYVGNLESYQGIDMLLDSFRLVHARAPEARLVIIGGKAEDINRYRHRAEAMGLGDTTHFVGPRPVNALDKYLRQADILVSPRIHGTNTPMKVYSYLGSGRAIVATDLPTHSQVMDESTAVLAEPEPKPFAESLIALIENPDERRRIGVNAARLAAEKYSWPAFERRVRFIFDEVLQQLKAPLRDP